jgi:hypothetical protein
LVDRRRWPRFLAAGLAGGFTLGVVARAWMRLISKDPEFTWSGSIFIVLGFTVFGAAQAAVFGARRQNASRWRLTAMRTIGALAMLPLFVAAGALMFPTVLGGSLALARVDWRRLTRILWLLPAAGPIVFVGRDLIDSFGWSARSLGGFVAMVAIYATIIWAARSTFAPQLDGWHLLRHRGMWPTD